MNRFAFALEAAEAPEQKTLADLARNFSQAIEMAEAEGQPAENDPAVIVLGAFIAFHTHSDVVTVGGYRRLLDLCEHRMTTAPELQ